MRVVDFPQNQYNQIGAVGDCPHCGVVNSYFRPVNSFQAHPNVPISIAQCDACKKYLLIVGTRPSQSSPTIAIEVYPYGSPNDTVDGNIPPDVAEDFKEALRCRFVKAYKGCIVMCRRAIQTSVLAKGGTGRDLYNQIDDLFSKGKITQPLKEFAHAIRLVGKNAAHPIKELQATEGVPLPAEQNPSTDETLIGITEQDAEDIIEFTKQYFEHVYIMPAKLAARSKNQTQTPNSSATVQA